MGRLSLQAALDSPDNGGVEVGHMTYDEKPISLGNVVCDFACRTNTDFSEVHIQTWFDKRLTEITTGLQEKSSQISGFAY